MRAFGDIGGTIDDGERREVLIERARRIVADCTGRLVDSDVERLKGRLALLENGTFQGD